MVPILSSLKNHISKYLQEKKYQADSRKYQADNRKAFLEGYNKFQQTGTTPHDSYMALVNLFCTTNGKFNEDIHQKIKVSNPPEPTPDHLSGILGDLSKENFTSINQTLNNDGYIRFDKKLSPETCAKLYEYALKTPAKVPGQENKIIYDPNHPVAEIYRFDIVDQINNLDIQSIIMDPCLINVAREYLGCEPIFDFPAMWWSTSFSKEASGEAAQLYHFDMDRIKWLKVFFYLNDVTPDNGPHCYIRASHKPGDKPEEVLKKGYARIEDAELKQYYKKEDFIELKGQAGTIFAGDTKCWHKGTPLKKGDRLVLEFEYTSSLFGANYPKLMVENTTDAFRQFCSQHKVYASNINFKSQL